MNEELRKTLFVGAKFKSMKELRKKAQEIVSFNHPNTSSRSSNDTLKDMKSGSDNLANYNRAFFNTMKMAQVYTCHIIQNKMTLVRHRIKPTSQSQVVECRSSSIFLSFSEIIQYTKVFELSLSCCILWLNRMEFVH